MTRPAAELTMVVPTYNERDRLAELVHALFAVASSQRVRLALVIVDDNSPDGTGAVADDLAREYPLTVVHRPGKLGLGSAVIEGMAATSSEIVGVMDADFSHPPAMVPVLLHALRTTGADFVVASRYVPGGSTPGWPVARRLMSRLACVLARPLTPVRDATSGFFLMKRTVGDGVEIQARGFKICLELLVRAKPERLVEVPFTFEDREAGESKMNWREARGYLRQLVDLAKVRRFRPVAGSSGYRRLTPAEVLELSAR